MKRHPFIFAFAAVFAAFLFSAATASPACAQSAPAAATNAPSSSEGRDGTIVNTVMNAANQGGYAAVTPEDIAELKEVISHAPASYPLIQRFPKATVVHAADMADYLVATAILAQEAKRNGTPANPSAWQPNVYGLAILMLAGYYDEMHQYAVAQPLLERGMKMQPGNWMMTLEYGSCLMAQHRQADAIAAIQNTLDHSELLSSEGRARLLRNRGVALIDLNRLDEAEAALNESIRVMPDNPQARNELNYIARLRGGQTRNDARMTLPGQASPAPQPGNEAGKPQKGN